MFVSDSLGIQNASGHMQEVEAWQAAQPWKQKLYQQELAKRYGDRVVVGAGGMMMGSDGQQVNPVDVLAKKGIIPDAPVAPGQSRAMPPLPSLNAPGSSPLPGRA